MLFSMLGVRGQKLPPTINLGYDGKSNPHDTLVPNATTVAQIDIATLTTGFPMEMLLPARIRGEKICHGRPSY